MQRRSFLKHAALSSAALAVAPADIFAKDYSSKLPAWKGFNLLDFFNPDPAQSRTTTPKEYFKWMHDWGFDFVRLPIAYPYYLDIDRSKNITPDDVYKINSQAIDQIESVIDMAHRYKMHVSLNMHRAPGFCVNAGFHEPYNLWQDQAAQDAFNFHWSMWAKKFKNTSRKKLSFDLLNEPCMRVDMNDQHSIRSAVPGELYRTVVKGAADVIRKENPDRLIVADGNNVGNEVIPEIIDLHIAQSCRGYFPGIISHYKAPWAMKDIENLPVPLWPGQVGEQYLSREMLENYYQPWIALAKDGVGVHCGECGCYNKTPHDVFIAWFGDMLDIFKQNKIGFALWEFDGSFGVLNSGREDVTYEDWHGQKLDRKLLTLMMNA